MSRADRLTDLEKRAVEAVEIMRKVRSQEDKNYMWTRVFNSLKEWVEENKK